MKNEFMQRAIELSIESINSGGGPFGSVITKGDEIIAEGMNRVTVFNDPTAHGEITAIRQACKKLKSEGALWPFHLLGILILIQFCLGILTLIFVVPIPLAVAHQAGAFMSLTAGLWALNGLSYRRRVNR